MSAAQELFEVLKDARPKDGPRHSAPVTKRPIATALKAVRFTVELPELGGAVELSPNRGFSPIHCKHCGIERESRQDSCVYKNKLVHWWAPVPCNCGGLRCE
jgi:hypothetical protein